MRVDYLGYLGFFMVANITSTAISRQSGRPFCSYFMLVS
jgi:hypothetical protein